MQRNVVFLVSVRCVLCRTLLFVYDKSRSNVTKKKVYNLMRYKSRMDDLRKRLDNRYYHDLCFFFISVLLVFGPYIPLKRGVVPIFYLIRLTILYILTKEYIPFCEIAVFITLRPTVFSLNYLPRMTSKPSDP